MCHIMHIHKVMDNNSLTKLLNLKKKILLPIKDLESRHLSEWYENHIASKSEES